MTAVPALAVEDLSVEFRTRSGTVKVLEKVGFEVDKGETVALVGEAGSGKSVTAFAVMGILDPAGRVTAGRALFGGADLLALSERDLAEQRGRELSMIFQNPRTALNPIRKVGRQIADVLVRHGGDDAAGCAARCRRDAEEGAHPRSRAPRRGLSLRAVRRHVPAHHDRHRAGLPAGAADRRRADHRPRRHHPGGDHGPDRRARPRIAAWRPSSSPTTWRWPPNIATASWSCMPAISSRPRPARALFAGPRHPYSAKLLAATPGETVSLAELASIPGGLPDLRRADLPPCRYSGRCERRLDECAGPLPHRTVGERHVVACWNPL